MSCDSSQCFQLWLGSTVACEKNDQWVASARVEWIIAVLGDNISSIAVEWRVIYALRYIVAALMDRAHIGRAKMNVKFLCECKA